MSENHAVEKSIKEAQAWEQQGRFDQAVATYDEAIALAPDCAPAYNGKGVALAKQGMIEAAITTLEQAMRLFPDDGEAYYSRGVLEFMLGRSDAAIRLFDQALDRQPNHAKAHHNKGIALFQMGKVEDAISSYTKAIDHAPAFAEAYNNRGRAWHHFGQDQQALDDFDQALDCDGQFAEAFNNKGAVLLEQGQFKQAFEQFDKAMSCQPNNVIYCVNRGFAAFKQGHLDDALGDFDHALSLDPMNADALAKKGNALAKRQDHDAAISCYDKAIAIEPNDAEIWNNKATSLHALLRCQDAHAAFDEAIRIDPEHAKALWNKSLLLILEGRFAEGWSLYEARLKDGTIHKPHPLDWRGERDISGKKLLIGCEQGLGDMIQFCRYLPMLAEQGADLMVETPRALIPLIRSLNCPMTIIPLGETRPEFDAYCPLMSLPYVFGTTVETIPSAVPYLSADPAKITRWQNHLGQNDLGSKTAPRVGITWSGNPDHINDLNRSIPMSVFQSIITDDVEWHVLQKDIRPHDQDVLAQLPQVKQHQDRLDDFAETAALVASMDYVISVDTSIAHVAGALGKPLAILLPYSPDYRWLLDRDDTPWYPSARLFRQKQRGQWQDVLAEVSMAVAGLTR